MADSSADLRNRFLVPDRLLMAGAFGLTLLIYLPLTVFFLGEVLDNAQLLQGLAIVGMAGATLVHQSRAPFRLHFDPSNLSLSLLVASFASTAVALLLTYPLALLVGYALALAAIIVFVFGPRAERAAIAFSVTLGAWMLLALTVVNFDWPLRYLAGQWGASVLGWLGQPVGLALERLPDLGVQLVLTVQDRPFLVAPECNGFGILSSGLLMALLLTIYRRMPILDKAVYIAGALLIGFVANILRIVVIVLLAPAVGDHYLLMHEIVGLAVYIVALGLIWYLISSHPLRPKPGAQTAS